MLLKQSAVLCYHLSKKYWYSLSEQKKYCLQINKYWINKNACLNTVLNELKKLYSRYSYIRFAKGLFHNSCSSYLSRCYLFILLIYFYFVFSISCFLSLLVVFIQFNGFLDIITGISFFLIVFVVVFLFYLFYFVVVILWCSLHNLSLKW